MTTEDLVQEKLVAVEKIFDDTVDAYSKLVNEYMAKAIENLCEDNSQEAIVGAIYSTPSYVYMLHDAKKKRHTVDWKDVTWEDDGSLYNATKQKLAEIPKNAELKMAEIRNNAGEKLFAKIRPSLLAQHKFSSALTNLDEETKTRIFDEAWISAKQSATSISDLLKHFDNSLAFVDKIVALAHGA